MSIRVALLTVVVTGLAIYAWRNWFVSLCGLILLMAVMQHPDMPTNIGGIQGLNPWNILMADILLAWAMTRSQGRYVWDMPRYVNILLILYLGVVVVGFLRMMVDRPGLEHLSIGYLVSEHLINCVKWVIPSLLLFDGCRTKGRVYMAMCCILGLYFLLALQVAKHISPRAAVSGDALSYTALKIISNNIGYSRVNMSMMLSGASWAIFAMLPLFRRWKWRLLILAAGIIVAYAQALTGGRMGYVAWATVGLILCMIRWRKALLFAPLVPLAIVLILPGTMERMLQGTGQVDAAGEEYTDEAEMTADRMLIWPYVIEKIGESPGLGYGRQAMVRTRLSGQFAHLGFSHPHNAYLEFMLDNGLLGFMLVMPFYGVVMWQAMRLFLDRHSTLCAAVGGMTCALVLALLVAAMGSQTFYPREGSLGMWAAIMLMFRVAVERRRQLAVLPVRQGSAAWPQNRVASGTPLPASGLRT
ncbi:MAG: O-antigen ligase family protein [Phycisphaerales bacterium]|nr:O-antigen ligase family protein [Phycisphaerales bacterium]